MNCVWHIFKNFIVKCSFHKQPNNLFQLFGIHAIRELFTTTNMKIPFLSLFLFTLRMINIKKPGLSHSFFDIFHM